MPRTRAFSTPAGPAFDAPLSDLNITPLIDVMLVLLVMMILTLPTVLHKVAVDLPQGSAPPSETVTHSLVLARDGGVTLDGKGLSDAAMPARFKALKADPAALLVMRTDPEARYDRFDQVLAEVKRAGITRLGFAGNEAMVERGGRLSNAWSYLSGMATKADLDAQRREPVDDGYDAWKREKIERGLEQSRDRSKMISVEQLLRDLKLER